MLARLIILSILVTDIYMEDISNMKCQPHHIHLEKCLKQKNQENNLQRLS